MIIIYLYLVIGFIFALSVALVEINDAQKEDRKIVHAPILTQLKRGVILVVFWLWLMPLYVGERTGKI